MGLKSVRIKQTWKNNEQLPIEIEFEGVSDWENLWQKKKFCCLEYAREEISPI